MQVQFGAMRFLEQAAKAQLARHTLQQKIVLLLRVLMMVALLIAFANPIRSSQHLATDSQTVIFIVDATASMHRQMQKATAWELARDAAIDQLSTFQGRKQPVMVYLLTDEARPILTEPSLNYAYLAKVLKQTQPSFAHGRFDQAIASIPLPEARALYLFTDAQQCQFPTPVAWKSLLGKTTCYIHIVDSRPKPNLAITSINWQSDNTPNRRTGQVRFTLHNDSSSRQTAKLQVDCETRKIAQISTELYPGQRKSISFPIELDTTSKIAIEGLLDQDDGIAWDNHMGLVLPQKKTLSVGQVDEHPVTVAMTRLFKKWGYGHFQPTNTQANLMIATHVSPADLPVLDAHLNGQGTLLWFLTDDDAITRFNTFALTHDIQLKPIAWEHRQTLLPQYWLWSWQDSWLDVFAGPYASPLNHISSSHLLTWDMPQTAILRMLATHSQQPVIWQRFVGEGNLLVVSIKQEQLQNFLQEPAILSVLLHLGHQTVLTTTDEQITKPQIVGQAYSPSPEFPEVPPQATPETLRETSIGLVTPDGELRRWDGQPIKLLEPGFYEFINVATQQSIRKVSVRVDPLESITTRIDPDDYVHLAGPHQMTSHKDDLSLWPVLIVIAVLLACAQTVLASSLRQKGGSLVR
ncbi:MAG: hypothetical protein JKX85_09940 [Phycisphaeraceae bacterium]|nr:hypothetical protein [Phycisphaeraceae bacterium]